jgi:hypothetical protein
MYLLVVQKGGITIDPKNTAFMTSKKLRVDILLN